MLRASANRRCWLEEALRLNRSGLAEEKAKLARLTLVSSSACGEPKAERPRA